jgi:hypothetical protein
VEIVRRWLRKTETQTDIWEKEWMRSVFSRNKDEATHTHGWASMCALVTKHCDKFNGYNRILSRRSGALNLKKAALGFQRDGKFYFLEKGYIGKTNKLWAALKILSTLCRHTQKPSVLSRPNTLRMKCSAKVFNLLGCCVASSNLLMRQLFDPIPKDQVVQEI